MSSNTPFKVIVIGGGPVGLTAAHALAKAGIDFVVLERRSTIVIQAGSDLTLLPMGMRVLNQLGLRERLEEVGAPMKEMQRMDHNGRDIGSTRLFLQLAANHGYHPLALSRHSLTEVLYEGLPSGFKDRLLPNKSVTEIDSTEDGVVVTCADGTTYAGSMVIGADGAHSKTRDQLRALALRDKASDVNDEKPFLTTFRAVWMRFPTAASDSLTPGQCGETHGPTATTQLFVGEKTAVIGLYERMEKPTRERSRYTEEDKVALVKRWERLPITTSLTFGEAFAGSIQSGIIDLEEGVVKHWHHGRLVLVGDAAHKYTPSTGQGCNTGILDIAALVNELRHTLEEARVAGGPDAQPSQDALSSAFRRFQDQRWESVTAGCTRASSATNNATWGTTPLWFFDCFIFSWHWFQNYFINKLSPLIAKSPVFDFIEWDEPISGKVPWMTSILAK